MVTLKFDIAKVRILMAHALKAKKHTPSFGQREHDEKPFASLFFVKDAGIYLMSNGEPFLPGAAFGQSTTNAVAYADGYGPECDYDKLRNAVGGDDFSEVIDVRAAIGKPPNKAKWLTITCWVKTRASDDGFRLGWE